jgi:hypothetical protein
MRRRDVAEYAAPVEFDTAGVDSPVRRHAAVEHAARLPAEHAALRDRDAAFDSANSDGNAVDPACNDSTGNGRHSDPARAATDHPSDRLRAQGALHLHHGAGDLGHR